MTCPLATEPNSPALLGEGVGVGTITSINYKSDIIFQKFHLFEIKAKWSIKNLLRLLDEFFL
jgi:hypothetical protein